MGGIKSTMTGTLRIKTMLTTEMKILREESDEV